MKMRNKINDRFVEERVSFIAAIFKAIFLALKRLDGFQRATSAVLYCTYIWYT